MPQDAVARAKHLVKMLRKVRPAVVKPTQKPPTLVWSLPVC